MTDELPPDTDQQLPEETRPPAPLGSEPEIQASGMINGWALLALLLTFAFLVPAFMLMQPAAQPSARAAHAARHGFIQLDNEEGALLYQAQLFQEGRGDEVYHPIEKPPYVAGTYTPLFMATVAAMGMAEPASFRGGRILVWCSALGIAMMLVILLASVTRNAPVAVLGGFLFLATWEVHRWIWYFRVDFPAIFLSLSGLAVIVMGGRKHIALALGAFLMVLGLYTKQSVIAAPAACFIALLARAPRLRAVEFAGWMLLWGLPPLVALHLWTDGEFLRHTFAYNINTWHKFNLATWSHHVWNMHRWFFISGLIAIPVAVALLAHGILVRRLNSRTKELSELQTARATSRLLYHFWQPLALYAVIAQWNFLGISKAGSAENYLLEPIAGWAIMISLTVGAACRVLPPVSSRFWIKPVATAGAVAILSAITLHAKVVTQPQAFQMRFSPLLHPGRADFEATQLILGRMRQAERPLSELALYHLQLKEPPVIQPFIMSELARQGMWNQEAFVEDIRQAKFDVIVALDDLTTAVPTDKYTAEMLAAFHAAYKLDAVYSTPTWNYHILTPKSAADAPTGAEIVGL